MGIWRDKVGLSALIPVCFVAGVEAAEPCPNPAGKFVSLEGAVEIAHGEKGDWQPASMENALCMDDSIRVGANSRASVGLINEAVLRLDQNTTMRLVDVAEKPEKPSFLKLVAGAFKSFSRAPRTLTVSTPYVNGMIEGTEFAMRVQGDSTLVTVFEGKVKTENDKGSLRLARGESAVAQAGKAPQPYLLVKPRDSVQWTLYYPPIFTLESGESSPEMSPATREAYRLSKLGDTSEALAVLDERSPESERDASFHILRAALLLNVGRAGEARAEIDRALAQNPKAGLAYAQRSIIEVVQNDRENALADARKSVELSQSATALIALSYAQQANFQIEAARESLQTAVKAHPNNALAWARLGELLLMLGDRKQALAAAKKAESLAPDQSRAQLVKGFTALAEFHNPEAKRAFEQAIRLNSADPIAHLGMGLAKISDGQLADGRKELEASVALDSSNALLRAYLGKAYFEEKRYPLDSQQYSIAKELDPNDPTAYLYDGILKQTINRPIEGLHDLQESIEHNDNREAYRGRLLLDQDRAARGTSLARIYNDLGFSNLGIIETGKSLSRDPKGDSAHRFLSDTYRGLRRRETARVSELYQAQMLQDININPVQPSLSETNLNIVTRGGASDPGFNEFTPLYERNNARLYSTGVFGNNGTYAGEGVVTALYDKLSLSAGGYHYSTNGWRPNNDLTHNIYDVFAQYAVSPELNIQGEFRHRESTFGDLEFAYLPSAYQQNARFSLNQDIARIGLRFSPSETSTTLLSYIHGQRNEGQDFPNIFYTTTAQYDNGADQAEAQHIFKHELFNLITGFSYAQVGDNYNINTNAMGMNIASVNHPGTTTDYRGYVYSNIFYPRNVTWTVGMSVVSYQDQGNIQSSFPLLGFNVNSPFSTNINQINPKFGLQWEIVKDLFFRATYTQWVKQSIVSNRTLEPTQVAGFNQFFDDPNGTKSQRYGVGLNWQASPDFVLGGDASWRNLMPITVDPTASPAATLTDQVDESLYQTYAYWTPLEQLAFRASVVYDEYRKPSDALSMKFASQIPLQVQTWSAPLSVSYFHSSGFFAGTGVTYVNQDVVRIPLYPNQGHDHFTLVDAGIGFRFPKRLGIASFQVLNLFNERFNYQDDTYREFTNEPTIGPYFPQRTLFGRITFNFGT